MVTILTSTESRSAALTLLDAAQKLLKGDNDYQAARIVCDAWVAVTMLDAQEAQGVKS